MATSRGGLARHAPWRIAAKPRENVMGALGAGKAGTSALCALRLRQSRHLRSFRLRAHAPESLRRYGSSVEPRRLQVEQLGVPSVCGNELRVRAVLDPLPVLEDDDPVGPADGREAVRD